METSPHTIQFVNDRNRRGFFHQFLLEQIRSFSLVLTPAYAIELLSHEVLLPPSSLPSLIPDSLQQSLERAKIPCESSETHSTPYGTSDWYSPLSPLHGMVYLNDNKQLDDTLPESFKLLTALVRLNGAPVTRGYLENRVLGYDFDFDFFCTMFLDHAPGYRYSLNHLGIILARRLIKDSDRNYWEPWSPSQTSFGYLDPQQGPDLKYKYSRDILIILGGAQTLEPLTRNQLAVLLNLERSMQSLDNSLNHLIREGYVRCIKDSGHAPRYSITDMGALHYTLFLHPDLH